MWLDRVRPSCNWAEAERHLSAVDPRLAKVIENSGPCGLTALPHPFEALVLSVFSQQLSLKGAVTLYGRFKARLGRVPDAAAVLEALQTWEEATIRHCGLSRQKRAYLIDLSQHVAAGTLDLAALADVPDAEVTRRLTAVKGIGSWTADMYLMFVLVRPDVLPVGDLGLREAVRLVYGLDARPDAAALETLARPWRPWRSVGTWYLWKAKGD